MQRTKHASTKVVLRCRKLRQRTCEHRKEQVKLLQMCEIPERMKPQRLKGPAGRKLTIPRSNKMWQKRGKPMACSNMIEAFTWFRLRKRLCRFRLVLLETSVFSRKRFCRLRLVLLETNVFSRNSVVIIALNNHELYDNNCIISQKISNLRSESN